MAAALGHPKPKAENRAIGPSGRSGVWNRDGTPREVEECKSSGGRPCASSASR